MLFNLFSSSDKLSSDLDPGLFLLEEEGSMSAYFTNNDNKFKLAFSAEWCSKGCCKIPPIDDEFFSSFNSSLHFSVILCTSLSCLALFPLALQSSVGKNVGE